MHIFGCMLMGFSRVLKSINLWEYQERNIKQLNLQKVGLYVKKAIRIFSHRWAQLTEKFQ